MAGESSPAQKAYDAADTLERMTCFDTVGFIEKEIV
jgi:hypothetical protein